MRSFRKTATVLMLVSFIFATAAPAMADYAGIAKGRDAIFTNIGDEGNFAGYSWMLYAKDSTEDADHNKYGYIITLDVMEKAKSDDPGSVTYQVFRSKNADGTYPADANKYSVSELRAKVNAYEAEMKGYSNTDGSDMTWAEANGGTGEGAKNYIVKHDMTETGTNPWGESQNPGFEAMSDYDDLLYVLSTDEAQALVTAGYGYGGDKKNILKASAWYWLRSPGYVDYAAQVNDSGRVYDGYYYDVGALVDAGFLSARPALQINLKSAIFQSNLFKTAAEGGKNLVTVGGGFSLPEVTAPATLTKQTKETLTFSGTPTASNTTTDVAETVASRIADGAIDLTTPLLTGKQLKVTYSNFGTNEAQDHVAAIVSTGSGSTETYVNYAKLSTNTTETDLIVDTSNLANGTYNLYVFGEKINGTHEDPDDTTTPVADAATRLVSAGDPFTLDNTYTNSGTLEAASHKDAGLTANLGGGFNLSFEDGIYDTGVTIGANDNGTITADETDGTILTGAVTVEENATLTTVNSFTLTGDNTVDGTVTGGALTIAGGTTTVSETGNIENELTVTAGGTLELNADKYGVTGGVENAVLDGGTLSLTGGTLTKAVTGGNLNVIGDVTSKADYIAGDTNTVTSDNILTLSAGTLAKEITGEGTTKIAGDVTTNAKVSTTAYTIGTAGNLTTDAQYIGTAIDNSGIVNLTAGTLTKAISGEGTTKIAGNVTAEADIATALTVDTTGELTTSADSLKNDVTNSGILNFTGGTLAKNYASTGTTNFKGKTKFNSEVSLTNSTLGFYLDNFSKGDAIIDSTETIDVAGTEIKLYQDVEGKKVEKEGDKLTLINNAEGYEGTKENPLKKKVISNVGMLDYEYDTWLENGELVMGVQGDTPKPIIKDQTKSFSEARLAGSAALNSASDLVASAVIENATAESKDWEAFAAIQGVHSRYETGSHIDLNSTNVAAGLSKKIKDNVTLGIFVEGGNGRYTTENEFEDGIVRADGDINYFGGGVFLKAEGKKTAKGQFHGEASFRAGHMNSDYNSETFMPGESTRFDTSNAYMGAHAGIGYKWLLKDNSNIDTYVKYLWNRQNSDSPVIDGEQFDLDAINSHRLRAGFRYNGKENENGVKFFGGLAYEYEFDGTAKGHMGEYALLEPDFKGGSGMAELGIKYHKANSPWKVELGVTGYTGKRDSIGANLGAWYEFGK